MLDAKRTPLVLDDFRKCCYEFRYDLFLRIVFDVFEDMLDDE